MKVEPIDCASVYREMPVPQITKNVKSHNSNEALVYPVNGPAVVIHIDPALFRFLSRLDKS